IPVTEPQALIIKDDLIAETPTDPLTAGAEALPASSLDEFVRFCETAEQIKATTKKLEKIALLSEYLGSLPAADAGQAALFFTARPFPQADHRTLNLGWSVIKRVMLDASGLSESDYRAAYQRFADAGDVTEAILSNRRVLPEPQEPATLSSVAEFFATLAAARGSLAKLELFRSHIDRFSPLEAKYVVKIITSDLRIGLKEGLVEEAIATSSDQTLDAVREANLLCGDLLAVTLASREGKLDAIQIQIFHPLQFMLASPEPTAEAIVERLAPPIWLEEKYDGIRCQLHKQSDRVELYSRDLHRITGQFPDLARAARSFTDDFIADGELLAWREGRALPFAELQKRLGRKGGDDFFLGAEIPVSISFYDLLWKNGKSLLKTPLSERRAQLKTVVSASGVSSIFTLAPVQQVTTALEIEAAFLASRQRGNEGLMAKDPTSPYTPGRRGLAWVKLKKAYATLDVVVVGVEYGHGKRRDVLSDYTFAIRDDETNQLLTVGKAYSGLTDVEIAELTQHFLENTLEVKGRFRLVRPDTVIEVAFDSIQPSNRHQSGFALRFPRIARIRTDKTPEEIDTLETCRKLAGGSLAFSQGLFLK
ncbi:MAG TPA: ATP-dependent DNA ligase, partial [Opitutaceae bacterium]|nr:ATP-dependent DNA ligase [Opitutaceae bacterium]